MGSTLTNGIYLPAEGERNCYTGLAANWTALDSLIGGYNAHIGNATIHVTAEDKATWNGKADASALTAHAGDTTIHVTAEDKATWNGKADASALTAHAGDTTIHVTAADKQAWNGKADASALTAHAGDTTIHVTAADKAKWDTVTGKANDADVVHKSGDEVITGYKVFENIGLTNSIKAISLENQTIDLNNCYSAFGNPLSGNISFYFCNTNDGTSNISNLPEQRAFFLISQSIRILSGGSVVYAKQILVNSNGKTFVRYCNNSVWGSWQDVTNLVTTDTAQTITGNKTFSSINSVEPSALSLPSDRSARIDISSYFTNTGTGQSNSYTVPANGYIYLTLSELTNVHCFSRTSGNVTNYAQTFTKLSNSTGALYVLFPVRKNDVFVATWYTTTTVSVDGAYFIPCQGNV